MQDEDRCLAFVLRLMYASDRTAIGSLAYLLLVLKCWLTVQSVYYR